MSRPRVKVARRPLLPSILTFLYPFLQPGIFMWIADRRGPNIPYPPPSIPSTQAPSPTTSAKQMDNTFINALVQACNCRQQNVSIPARRSSAKSLFTYHRVRRRNVHSSTRQSENTRGSRPYAQTHQLTGRSLSRDDYRQMLDYYREPCNFSTTSSAAHGPLPSPSSSVPFQCDSVPYIYPVPDTRSTTQQQTETSAVKATACTMYHDKEDCPVPFHPKALSYEKTSRVEAVPSTEGEEPHENMTQSPFDIHCAGYHDAIKRLQMYLEDETASHDQIYEAYLRLPAPGVSFLSNHSRRLLLLRLSVIERKTKKAMLRYLTLVDHMKEASIPLKESEWNSAIAYAGRCFVRVEDSQVESALLIWKEMEHEAGVRSGGVTFNILFDIAIKGGRYVLAEMILEEMKARGLGYSRFSHVGFIYFHGVKCDGAGVRKAYGDLVEAGQIVDTVVMNCVIASLIRAGELPAAEQVYERMKRLAYRESGQSVPTLDWRASRNLARALDRASRTMRNGDPRLQRLQAEQCLAPNLRTICIFINHHVHETGELRRVTALLEEMQALGIPMDGRIFVKIFRGFAYHGGVKYTLWTQQRLETVWTSLLSTIDNRVHGVHIMKWMVVWIIRAFAQCCGRKRALQIWEEVRDRWRIAGEDEKGIVEYLLRDALEDIDDEGRQ